MRALLLADENADSQAGERQHHHERLIGGDIGAVLLREVDGCDESHLGQEQTGRHAFEPEADRRPDHRQEEQVEELKAEGIGDAEHDPQGAEPKDQQRQRLP